jgi:N-methylhydantoinase B
LLNSFFYPGANGGEVNPPMVSKVTDVRIATGQRVRLETPGGGGFGDPKTRDAARVERDVRLGYVTAETARRDYGVALGKDGAVDMAATATLRKKA